MIPAPEAQQRLHPEIAERVVRLGAAAGKPAHLQTPAEVRAAFLAARQPPRRPVAGLLIEDMAIAAPAGHSIALRRYSPTGCEPMAAFAYFHGGGFTNGDLDSHDAIACAIALQGRLHVVSVDYRVLPAHPFPAAFDDAVAVLRWLPAWAESLGIGERHIAAGGDSSGANLALAATLALLDETALQALWLAYPIIGADFETASYRENAHAPLLTRARCQRILADYLGRPIEPGDWRVAPLLSPELHRLPPLVTIAAELDPLRSDAEILLARLSPLQAQRSRLVPAPGMPHGFLRWIGDSAACARILRESIDRLSERVGAGLRRTGS